MRRGKEEEVEGRAERTGSFVCGQLLDGGPLVSGQSRGRLEWALGEQGALRSPSRGGGASHRHPCRAVGRHAARADGSRASEPPGRALRERGGAGGAARKAARGGHWWCEGQPAAAEGPPVVCRRARRKRCIGCHTVSPWRRAGSRPLHSTTAAPPRRQRGATPTRPPSGLDGPYAQFVSPASSTREPTDGPVPPSTEPPNVRSRAHPPTAPRAPAPDPDPTPPNHPPPSTAAGGPSSS